MKTKIFSLFVCLILFIPAEGYTQQGALLAVNAYSIPAIRIDFLNIFFPPFMREWIPYMIAILSIGLLIMRKTTENHYKDKVLHVMKYILLMVIFLLELYYFIFLKGNTWFCEPNSVGWIMTIINFFIFAWVLYNQIISYFDVVEEIMDASEPVDFRVGIYSIPIAVALGIACHFLLPKNYGYVVVVLLCIAQLVQVFLIFKRNGLKYWGYALSCTLLYLAGLAATIVTLINFISLLIIALLIYVGLRILGSDSGGKTCRTCRSYGSDGYCHYRREYVRSNDSCNHHQ